MADRRKEMPRTGSTCSGVCRPSPESSRRGGGTDFPIPSGPVRHEPVPVAAIVPALYNQEGPTEIGGVGRMHQPE